MVALSVGIRFILLAADPSNLLTQAATFEESQYLPLSFYTQQIVSGTEVDVRGPKDRCSSPDGNMLDGGEREVEEDEEKEEEANEEEELGGEEYVISDEDYDTDLELGGRLLRKLLLDREGEKKGRGS